MLDLSIVIPVFNSESSLPYLTDRIINCLAGLSFEIILVNDGSRDGSLETIKRLARQDARIKLLSFYKNFGQIPAIYAGLAYAQGATCVVLDDDLQNPPESIIPLINEIKAGYDFAFGVPLNRVQSIPRNILSRLSHRLSEILFDKPKGVCSSSFMALRNDVVRKLVEYKGPYPYLAGQLFKITHHGTSVRLPFGHRKTGRSNYNLRRLIRLWLSGITNNSIVPLRLASALGFLCASLGFGCVTIVVILKWYSQDFQAGWPSIIGTVILFAGIQLVALGLIGEYLGRVFNLVNHVPQYHIKESMNFSTDSPLELPK